MTDDYRTVALVSTLRYPSGQRYRCVVTHQVSEQVYREALHSGPERSMVMESLREVRGRYLTDHERLGPGIFPVDAVGEQWREDDADRQWEDEQWWDGDPSDASERFIRGDRPAQRLEW